MPLAVTLQPLKLLSKKVSAHSKFKRTVCRQSFIIITYKKLNFQLKMALFKKVQWYTQLKTPSLLLYNHRQPNK
jgi:hypothetical protein